MSRNLPPHELYSNKLSHLDLGYALFEPNPNGDYDMVRVGDVGYIEGGKFEKFFNAFYPADDPANDGSDIPAGFEPIRETFRRTGRLETLTPGVRQSTGVRTIGGDLSFSGPISGVLAGTNLKLSCKSGIGATLITKHCATRQRAKALRGMMKYMLDNRYSWLRLARDLGRLVELHDLVFVKECILTGDWANISWNDSSHDAEVSFNINVPGTVGASLSLWGQWENHAKVPRRQGPSRPTGAILVPEGLVLDQCIFLKGYRIALREWYNRVKFYISAKIIKPTRGMVKRKMPFSSNPSLLSFFETVEYKLESVGDTDPGSFRPNSNADVAIMDDDDLLALNIASADNLQEICALLRRNRDLRTKIMPSEPGDHGLKVGRIDWELLNLRKASADASYNAYETILDAPTRDMVFLDEQFNEVRLGQKRSTASMTAPKTDPKGKSRTNEMDHEAMQLDHSDWSGPSYPSYNIKPEYDTTPRGSTFFISTCFAPAAGNPANTRLYEAQPINASTRVPKTTQPYRQQPLYNRGKSSRQDYFGTISQPIDSSYNAANNLGCLRRTGIREPPTSLPASSIQANPFIHELSEGLQRMTPWTREELSGLRHDRTNAASPTPTSTSTSTSMSTTTTKASTASTSASSFYSVGSSRNASDKTGTPYALGLPTEEDARNAYRQNPSSNGRVIRNHR
ncbi:hypothetical protein M0805_009029 [Coniferiporia weirii]|nr:hypothetical protein M0805_009029 [Coniferiporia weirii]